MAGWLQSGGVLVISSATLRGFPLEEHLPEAHPMDLLVADEAHYIKNPEAQRTQAVARLVAHSDRVSFMTGTPMENHPREFARLIECLRPEGGFALSEEELEDPHSGVSSGRFRQEVARFYLRRNQADVLLELPEKIEVEEWVTLTTPERQRYDEAVRDGNFMAMRQRVTLDPDLGDAPSSRASSKMQRLAELLAEHREEGRKILVFSFFRKVLEQIAAKHENVGTIEGGVTQSRRMEMMESFQSAPGTNLLLAQITAAGQGLNLQAASVVILMEPQLTPGAEAQAIARAHRMGQTQRVVVHRLLAAGSVDQRLVEVLREKAELFDDYARESVSKERNPEATETQIVNRIIRLEQERLGAPQAQGPSEAEGAA